MDAQLLLDLAVGAAFLAVAGVCRAAPHPMRAWWVAIALTWWAGDVAALRVVHQGLLLAALATFPTGRATSGVQYGALIAGGVVATGWWGQGAAAGCFLASAALVARTRLYPLLCASLVGAWLGASFVWSRAWPETFAPQPALVGYELLLLLVAVALPWGLADDARRRSALADRVLAGDPGGVSGLEAALRATLRRPGLRITRTPDDDLAVEGLGTVDPATAAAVDRAVSLTAAHEQALAEAEHRLRELEAARYRLLTAGDTERRRAARQLRRQIAALRACLVDAALAPHIARELVAAVDEIERVVSGLPPDGLGAGGIGPALARLCARHPVPVTLAVDDRAAADVATETVLYFVCAEALTNSAKHAGAQHVGVTLRATPDLVLTVIDDGRGGAHRGGSGLLGLEDRLATLGGALRLASTPGGGTRLEARLPPLRRSALSVDPHEGLEDHLETE